MNAAPKAEIATVIQNFLPELHRRKPLPNHHLRTLHALQRCRTEAMGGRVEQCDQCGREHIVYNSCRNRHCPKCGNLDREKWLINREADLLPVNYMHVVFTLPDKLNKLFLHHQVDCYNILPPGFTRIRYYGFLSSAAKTKAMVALRLYFFMPEPNRSNLSWQEIAQSRMGINPQCCSKCGGVMQTVKIIPDRFHRPIRAPTFSDVS